MEYVSLGSEEMLKIIAGIVLYNAETNRLFREIESVLSQVDMVCLCDNGSTNISLIEKKIISLDKVVLLKNRSNLGIGTASNQICSYAEKNGFDWVLMLDHDTICPSNLVSTYVKYIGDPMLGMLCPNVVDSDLVQNVYNSKNESETEYVNRCIQSAIFIRVSAWKKCGGFNEWMFIDFVDFDFCKRMEINGYKILRCCSVTVDHQLGKRVFSKHVESLNKLYEHTRIRIFKYLSYKNVYSEARVYYCTRNNIAYIKIYKNHINNLKEWEEFILRIVKRIIRSENRYMILKTTIKGIKAGIDFDLENYEKGQLK